MRITIHAQADVILPKPHPMNPVRRALGRAVPTYTAPLVAEAVVDVQAAEAQPTLHIRRDKDGLFLLLRMAGRVAKERVVSHTLREVGETRNRPHRLQLARTLEGDPMALLGTLHDDGQAVTFPESVMPRELSVQEVAAIFEVPEHMLTGEASTLSALEASDVEGVRIGLRHVEGATVATHGQPKDMDEFLQLVNGGGGAIVDATGKACLGWDREGAMVSPPGGLTFMGKTVADPVEAATLARENDANGRGVVVPLFPEGTDVPHQPGDATPPTSATSVLHDLTFLAERLEVAQFQIAFTAGGADAGSVDNEAHVALKAVELLRAKVNTMHANAAQAVRSVEAARLLVEACANPGSLRSNRAQLGVHLENALHHVRRTKAEHNPALDLREVKA